MMTYNQATMADTDVIAPGALKGFINLDDPKAGCAYRAAPGFDQCGRPAVVKVTNHDRSITAWLCASHAQGVHMGRNYSIGVAKPSTKWQIITHIAAGDSDKEICAALGLSNSAVQKQIADMRAQSGARNRTHLAVLFVTNTYRP